MTQSETSNSNDAKVISAPTHLIAEVTEKKNSIMDTFIKFDTENQIAVAHMQNFHRWNNFLVFQ